MRDYDYWQGPSLSGSPPPSDDQAHTAGRGPARGHVVRRPCFSLDAVEIPTAPRVRHVPAPDHVTYHRSASPPTGLHMQAPRTYFDYAGEHILPETKEDVTGWTQQSNPGSSILSGESYRLVDVRDVDIVDERGRRVRVREIEETHHPGWEGGHGGDVNGRGKAATASRKAAPHTGSKGV